MPAYGCLGNDTEEKEKIKVEFYLDESGNTGGISQQAFESIYGGQKIFTLAAIGVPDETQISITLAPLLKRFNIKSRELKSSKLYKKKPEFIADVFSLIKNEGWPIFIEAVDKKFMLTANIVNSLILPGYCLDGETKETNYIRNVFAEYLFNFLPDDIYLNFLKLCSTPYPEELMILIDQFIGTLRVNKNDVSIAIIQSLTLTREDIEDNLLGDEGDISAFLPIPDEGKHGKMVWMLPNLSSFTNIYARINLFMDGKLSGVKIYHNEQLQYDHIIETAKYNVESLPFDTFGFVSDSTDYRFEKSADLFFKTSHESIGIQLADIVAGFTRSYIEQTQSNQVLDSTIRKAHKTLMTMNREKLGLGMNMVLSAQDSDKINTVWHS